MSGRGAAAGWLLSRWTARDPRKEAQWAERWGDLTRVEAALSDGGSAWRRGLLGGNLEAVGFF